MEHSPEFANQRPQSQPQQIQHSQSPPTPVYLQPKAPSAINTAYISTVPGVLNLLIMVFVFPAWVSIAAVPKNIPKWTRTDTENAFLFFGILAFLVEIVAFVIYLLNVPKKDALRNVPFNLILAVKDILFAIPIFSLSISSAVRESQRNKPPANYETNYGAFAAAALFGFITTLIYIAHCAVSTRKHLGERRDSNQNGAQ